MMDCNDLALANESLFEWKKDQPITRKEHQIWAGMYFVRTQISHLYEGLKVIEAIRKSPILLALVKRCDTRAQESFQNLEDYLLDGSKRAESEKLAGLVRHNLTFHYDKSGKLIKFALSDRAAKSDERFSSLTRGDNIYLWRFKIADNILDSIVVHQIWGIHRTVDLRIEADKVADKLHQIFLWFMDFSGEFIWKYF